MKKTLQDMFEYMSHEKNWHQSIMLMICYSLAFMLIGMALAWVVSIIIDRKVNKPVSFDDFYSQKGFKQMKKAK